MKKNIKDKIFILTFMIILIVPFVTMNFKHNQTSDIDNKVLTEFPELTLSSETIETIENYVDDRVGFREQAIAIYTNAADKLFGVMIHPLFMYGKDGHIFYKDPDYISAYQRLNTDEEYLDDLVDFLVKTNDYLDRKNIKFLYYLCPDKKSIYSEFFPDSIHVKEDNTPIIKYMKDKLSETDIEYVIPDDELREAKKTQVVYNKMYDATHWNEFGSFLAHKLLDKHIQNWFDDIRPLSEDDYSLEFVKMTNLDTSSFPIDDDVPVYILNVDTSEDATEYLEPYLDINTTTFYAHYMNPNVDNGKKLLVFTDSYFATYHKYYNNRFSEVYYVHRQNYDFVQYVINLVFPDAVVFETAERSISSEMPILCDFKNYYYEPSYNGEFDSKKAEIDLSYTITDVKGVRVDGNKIFISPEGGENIVSINGVMNDYDACKNLDIYMVIDGNYVETDYCMLHRKALEEGLKRFSMNVQRRFVAPSEIKLIAVDRETNSEYLIDTFEVEYGN